MATSTIKDWRIKIIPGSELIKLLISLEKNYNELPENIIKIIQEHKNEKVNKKILSMEKLDIIFNETEKNLLKNELSLNENDFKKTLEIYDIEEKIPEENENALRPSDAENIKLNTKFYLVLNDIKWLNSILITTRTENNPIGYIHELLKDSELLLPENEIIPRNPVLEARCIKLKIQQENEKYRNITKGIDAARKHLPEDTIAYQIKAINRQLIAVAQFIVSVAAGFAFGFIGISLIVGNLEFGFRLLLGIICALIIGLAEMYFLAKKLNQFDDIPKDDPTKIPKKPHED